MTENEALKEIKKLYPKKCKMVDGRLKGGFNDHESKGGVAIDMAIQALEKQIPKKVKIEQWIYTKCDCGYEFSRHHGDGYYSIPLENKTKYCPNCGQKIDFGE